MEMTVLPNCVLCMWVETGHIRGVSEVEEKRICRCWSTVEADFNLYLHLQTHDTILHTFVLLSLKGSPSLKKEAT